MTAPLTFHLPPDAGPDWVQALFATLTALGGCAAPATLRERAADMLGNMTIFGPP